MSKQSFPLVFVYIYVRYTWGNIWKLTVLTCLFVQPIAAHDYNIFLIDTSFNANFKESSCEEHCSPWFTAQREGAGSGNATHWVTADSNWRAWLLAGAAWGRADWWQYTKFSPHGITERKRRTASYSWRLLLSYKLICMWGFSSPLMCHQKHWKAARKLKFPSSVPKPGIEPGSSAPQASVLTTSVVSLLCHLIALQ